MLWLMEKSEEIEEDDDNDDYLFLEDLFPVDFFLSILSKIEFFFFSMLFSLFLGFWWGKFFRSNRENIA